MGCAGRLERMSGWRIGVCATGVPHVLQKCAPARTSVAHVGQRILCISLLGVGVFMDKAPFLNSFFLTGGTLLNGKLLHRLVVVVLRFCNREPRVDLERFL